jgi:hypothetical protein
VRIDTYQIADIAKAFVTREPATDAAMRTQLRRSFVMTFPSSVICGENFVIACF